MSTSPPKLKYALFKILDDASKEECEEILVNLMIPKCRPIYRNLLGCLKKGSESMDLKKMTTFKDVIKESKSKILFECRQIYDIKKCIRTHGYKSNDKNIESINSNHF